MKGMYLHTKGNVQYVTASCGRFTYSIAPVYRLEFNVPMVKVPPGSRTLTWEMLEKRVSWKAITGSSHAPDEASVCQKGSAPEEAIDCHARPIKPEVGESRSPVETTSQRAVEGNYIRGISLE
jgi:hypothetical protein